MWSPGRERKAKSQLPPDPKDQGAEHPGISDLGDFPNLPPHLQTISKTCQFLALKSACLSPFSLPPS